MSSSKNFIYTVKNILCSSRLRYGTIKTSSGTVTSSPLGGADFAFMVIVGVICLQKVNVGFRLNSICIFFSRCNRILLNDGGWNELRLDGLQFLEALVYCHFADLTNAIHILLGDVQVAHLRDKVDDAGCNGVRCVFRYHVVLLNAHSHEHAQFGEFGVDVERTAVAFNECARLRFLKTRFFGIVQVVFQFIDDRQRIFAAFCCALVVQPEYGGNFLRSARAPVRAARNVNGC